MDLSRVEFMLSVHSLRQLPDPEMPEIAFAGRSNVGKSSLMNRLLGRSKLVKTSARPGKTQALNFFQVGEHCRLVDLPGYGYARVPKGMKNRWQTLITSYLERRSVLACVVVIIDIRHEARQLDSQLLDWLRQRGIPFVAVYTKTDKVSGSVLEKNARRLDVGHRLAASQRVLFSAVTGRGKSELKVALATFLQGAGS